MNSNPCIATPPASTASGPPWLGLSVLLLAWAGAGALVGPFFGQAPPTLRELAMFGGFTTLIVRTRFKEG